MIKEKPVQNEKPRPLGDRVYTKHRKMVAAIAKNKRMTKGEALRFSIEDTYDRVVGTK